MPQVTGAWWRDEALLADVTMKRAAGLSPAALFHVVRQEGYATGTEARFRARLSQLGIHGPRPSQVLEHVVGDTSGLPDEPPTLEDLVSQTRTERERQRERAELRVLREMATDNADFLDAVRAELARFPVSSIPRPDLDRERRGRPATLLLHLSDVHLGQLFESYVNGSYNLDVAALRVSRIAEKVVAIVEALRAHRQVERLVIGWGGDIVDGRDIHPGHDWQSVPMEVQLNRGTQVMRDCLLEPLARTFPSVVNICVPGNHGRIGKKGQLHRTKDSMDTVFYAWLEDRCAGMGHVVWQTVRDSYYWFSLHGHGFILAHGDAFRAWGGIPFYGANRYLQNLSSMLHKPVDALLVGHHHQAANWRQGHSVLSMNGSVVAGGEFATFLGYGGPAVQKLHLVEDRFPVATSYDLVLTERHEVITAEPANLDDIFAAIG